MKARRPGHRYRAGQCLALLLACLPLAPWANENDDRWGSLSVELAAVAAAEGVPGHALVIVERSGPVLTASTWSPDTPLRWGSITKSFTALAALRLAEEQRLDLDAPVRRLIPVGVFANPWAGEAPLTTRHLLELTAGLPDLGRDEWDDNTPRPLAAALNARVRRLLWPPGLQHSYSNVPPGLTAAVVEAASGKPFADYLGEAVLRPLGMPRASLAPVTGLPGGYAADGRTRLPYWHVTFPAFGALKAPLPEMARALTMLLNGGELDGKRVFSPASVEAMFSPGSSPAVRAGLEVGYGAGMYGWSSQGRIFFGHGGDADGYRSRYGLLPAAGRGYLLAINADRPDALRRMQRLVEAALCADLTPQQPVPLVSLSDAELQRYVGAYYPSSVRFNVGTWQRGGARRAAISLKDGALSFQRGERQARLLPTGPGRFRRAADPAVTAVFVTTADGVVYLHGELGNYVKTSRCPGFLPTCHQ